MVGPLRDISVTERRLNRRSVDLKVRIKGRVIDCGRHLGGPTPKLARLVGSDAKEYRHDGHFWMKVRWVKKAEAALAEAEQALTAWAEERAASGELLKLQFACASRSEMNDDIHECVRDGVTYRVRNSRTKIVVHWQSEYYCRVSDEISGVHPRTIRVVPILEVIR